VLYHCLSSTRSALVLLQRASSQLSTARTLGPGAEPGRLLFSRTSHGEAGSSGRQLPRALPGLRRAPPRPEQCFGSLGGSLSKTSSKRKLTAGRSFFLRSTSLTPYCLSSSISQSFFHLLSSLFSTLH